MKTSVLILGIVALFASDVLAKNVNVSLNPLGLISGTISTGVEVRLTDRVTAGPYLRFGSSKSRDSEFSNFGYGGRVDYALTGLSLADGWYASGFASRYAFKGDFIDKDDQSNVATTIDYNFDATNLGAILGYGWFWQTGFNLRFGLGVMRTHFSNIDSLNVPTAKEKDKLPEESTLTLPSGELIFAWAL